MIVKFRSSRHDKAAFVMYGAKGVGTFLVTQENKVMLARQFAMETRKPKCGYISSDTTYKPFGRGESCTDIYLIIYNASLQPL